MTRSVTQVETATRSLTLLPFGPVVSSLFSVRKLAGKIPEKFSGVPKESVDIVETLGGYNVLWSTFRGSPFYAFGQKR